MNLFVDNLFTSGYQDAGKRQALFASTKYTPHNVELRLVSNDGNFHTQLGVSRLEETWSGNSPQCLIWHVVYSGS